MQLRKAVLPAAAIAVLAIAPTALGGNSFAGSTSTASGYHTYDSDLIDVEKVSQTGAGVYVAVLDTGLVPRWEDYFPTARIATQYGKGFYQPVYFKSHGADPCAIDATTGAMREVSYIGSRSSSHGSHVTSTIIGFNYQAVADAQQGFPLPPIQVRGIAPEATIIPVRVLFDYQTPALPKCDDPALQKQGLVNFGTSEMVAAGIDYVTSLKQGPLAGHPVVISMSLGGEPDVPISDVEKGAIDRAIAAGVIVVAAASNDGEAGMGAPGSYAPVISAGSIGWTGQWLDDGASGNAPANGFRYRMWWLQNVMGNGAGTEGDLGDILFENSGDVTDETPTSDVFVSDFSSREHAGQDLDVLAPGDWVRGPFPGTPGYNQFPWWAKGQGNNPGGNYFYVGGTSMATPHVSGVVALMLQKNPNLTAAQAETILTSSAIPLGAGSRQVWDPFHVDADGNADPSFITVSWNADAVGEGILQADGAVAATP